MSNYVDLKDVDDNLIGKLPTSSEGGRLRNIVYMAESGTYEKPVWLKFVRVKGVGGGGGRGGIAATASNTVGAVGSGGAGGYFEKRINAADLAASETVTIGSAGAAGSSGNTTGGTGGTTSFGSHCSATGGAGGGPGQVAATVTSLNGAHGIGIGGDINLSGYGTAASRGYYLTSGGPVLLPAASSASAFGSSPNPGAGVIGAVSGVNIAARVGEVGVAGSCIVGEYE